MGSDQIRRRRKDLSKRDPYCWYCGIQVFEYGLDGGPVPPDQATLEHLFSRRNPERREAVPLPSLRRVLACYDCNNDRGFWTSELLKEDRRQWRLQDAVWRPAISQLAAMT
jgi:5-methylcytosine-specific restriction endonuclease McrA